MKPVFFLLALAVLAAGLAPPAGALTLGQFDDFEDGTTQGWTVGLQGAPHPAPPVNIADGGPGGAHDNDLRLTSVGGQGPGSRLSAINVTQWAGDYLSEGVHFLGMDLRNLGATDLSLRLLFADPTGGPPANVAISSDPILLGAGGAWTRVYFAIDPSDLTPILGSAHDALSGATELRLFHGAGTAFPPDPIAAQLGVDNITALASVPAVPEPSTWCLLAAGVGLLASWRRKR